MHFCVPYLPVSDCIQTQREHNKVKFPSAAAHCWLSMASGSLQHLPTTHDSHTHPLRAKTIIISAPRPLIPFFLSLFLQSERERDFVSGRARQGACPRQQTSFGALPPRRIFAASFRSSSHAEGSEKYCIRHDSTHEETVENTLGQLFEG